MRKMNRMTQEDIAEKLGVTRQAVANGKQERRYLTWISARYLRRYSKCLLMILQIMNRMKIWA